MSGGLRLTPEVAALLNLLMPIDVDRLPAITEALQAVVDSEIAHAAPTPSATEESEKSERIRRDQMSAGYFEAVDRKLAESAPSEPPAERPVRRARQVRRRPILTPSATDESERT